MSLNERHFGVVRDGRVELEVAKGLAEGMRVVVRPLDGVPGATGCELDDVIIAGFGLAGRCVADFMNKVGGRYTVVEKNPDTVDTQQALGRTFIFGDISDEDILELAGVRWSTMLALTVPDEKATLKAVEIAKRLNPKIYVVARTTYASRGLQCAQKGANEVIKSEQAVALMFSEMLDRLHRCAKATP